MQKTEKSGLLDQIKSEIEMLEKDYNKFTEKGNFAAGTRVRLKCQQIKGLLGDLRSEVLEKRKA